MKKAIITTVTIFLTLITVNLQAEEIDRYNGFGFSTGLGSPYAAGFGGAVEYYYMFQPRHTLAAIADIGQTLTLGYAGTLRYAYGYGDRFICDLSVGKVGTEETKTSEYNFETHEWEDAGYKKEDIYNPSLCIGYQRITSFGLTATITVGAGLGSSIIPIETPEPWLAFTLALGYKL